MKVHDSARKHGIDPQDVIHAAEHAVFVADLDDDSPTRQLRLGFDTAGRILEIVVLRFDSGNELVIHAASTSTPSTDHPATQPPRTRDQHGAADSRGRLDPRHVHAQLAAVCSACTTARSGFFYAPKPRNTSSRRSNSTTWPAGSRLILRKERPHPGAPLSFTGVDRHRVTAVLTNTPARGRARAGPGSISSEDLVSREAWARLGKVRGA